MPITSTKTPLGKGYTGDAWEIFAKRLMEVEVAITFKDTPTSPHSEREVEMMRWLLAQLTAWVSNGQSLEGVKLQFPFEIPDGWLFDGPPALVRDSVPVLGFFPRQDTTPIEVHELQALAGLSRGHASSEGCTLPYPWFPTKEESLAIARQCPGQIRDYVPMADDFSSRRDGEPLEDYTHRILVEAMCRWAESVMPDVITATTEQNI